MYLAIFSRWLGGTVLSSKPGGIPPCSTPTRFMASSCSDFRVREAEEEIDGEKGTYVVCGVRMVINTAKECSCCIFTNVFDQQMRSAGMFTNEGADIMNETGDEDKMALLRLFLD